MCNTARSRDEADPRYTRLAQMGFAAVPALIEHLDDDRLTRSVKQGFNNFPTWNMRIKDVVSDLLQELAGEDVGKDWLRRQTRVGRRKSRRPGVVGQGPQGRRGGILPGTRRSERR